MTVLGILIPAALLLGGLGLAAFLWSLKSGQYDDLDGAAMRILDDEGDKAPPSVRAQPKAQKQQGGDSGQPVATEKG